MLEQCPNKCGERVPRKDVSVIKNLAIYVTVPEKRDLNEANMKNEIYTLSFSPQYELQNGP